MVISEMPKKAGQTFPTCRVCGSSNVEYQTLVTTGKVPFVKPNKKLTIAACPDCGFANRAEDREASVNLAIQKQRFEENVAVPHKSYTRWPHRPALISREIHRLAGNTGRVLDIGCNTGLNLAALGKGWQKYGVELSPTAAQIAQSFAQAEVFCGPIESFQAAPNSFDVIMAYALIEHVSNPNGLISWVFEYLKPSGLFILMTGDRESSVALQMGADWPLYWPEEHMSFFSARSLCKVLEGAGFQIVRREWRFMYTAQELGSPPFRLLMKVKEILRLVSTPIYDHFYCYARKPTSCLGSQG